MTHYCTRCGAKLRNQACFCQECGAPVASNHPSFPGFCQNVAPLLTQYAQKAVKLFALLLMSGGSAACGLAALCLLGISAWILYQYAVGGAVLLPWLICNSLQGPALLMIGLMAAFIAVLLAAITSAFAQSVRNLTQ